MSRAPGRRALRGALLALAPDDDGGARALLAAALAAGRQRLRERLAAKDGGHALAAAMSADMDAVTRALMDHVARDAEGERQGLALIAVGGWGRGEMAPFSDLDLLFLLPGAASAARERVVARALHLLWDLGLKVGHAVRSADDALARAGDDMTVRTALLEARFLWGERGLWRQLARRFQREVVAGSGEAFVRAKRDERAARHRRFGDSRYLLEPHVKDGKGGLRDLHALLWTARYLYRIASLDELAAAGIVTGAELARWRRASDFLLRVRWHLHLAAGRAEERLTFDRQAEIARRMGYSAGRSQRAVERFMKRYFLVARDVGGLERAFAAALDDPDRGGSPRGGEAPAEVAGFPVAGGRLTLAARWRAAHRPLDLLRIFQVALEEGMEVHPAALRRIARHARAVDGLRASPQANALFMALLTSRRGSEGALRAMNEAGVMGRFLPDFARAVAQMQFDMYHVYTVDEHAIRAVGELAAIERGAAAAELPLASAIASKVERRRVLYLAALLHDVAKGRGGDHSVLGAGMARRLGPRLGLDGEETETAAWLVRHHLLMSATAFRRDPADAETVAAFVATVQSMERLRLLLLLTVADIRAVGPGVWNGWKGQLLRELYRRAEESISGGHGDAIDKRARVAALADALRAGLGHWPAAAVEAHIARLVAPYWLAFEGADHLRHAALMRRAAAEEHPAAVDARVDDFRAVTDITAFGPDRQGLFARLAGAIAGAGAGIVEARIFTTTDGMALDSFRVQDERGGAFDDPHRLRRLRRAIRAVLRGEADDAPRRPLRGAGLAVAPRVAIDNGASSRHSLVEVTARDRPGLLRDLAGALAELGLSVVSARVATYGERAVDSFYVRDGSGRKVSDEARLARLRQRLLAAIAAGEAPGQAA